MAASVTTRDQKKAAAERGVVLFEDECVFQQSGTIARSWCRVGVGGEVFSKPVRRSCKVYGAVSLDAKRPKFHFRFLREEAKDPRRRKFNVDTFTEFLESVIRYYRPKRKRVHMIVDGAKYHKTAVDWVERNSKYIELHFLPAYSPNLNATEMIWQNAKRHATHNRFFKTLKCLHDALFRRFNRYQGNPAALRGIIARWV